MDNSLIRRKLDGMPCSGRWLGRLSSDPELPESIRHPVWYPRTFYNKSGNIAAIVTSFNIPNSSWCFVTDRQPATLPCKQILTEVDTDIAEQSAASECTSIWTNATIACWNKSTFQYRRRQRQILAQTRSQATGTIDGLLVCYASLIDLDSPYSARRRQTCRHLQAGSC